MKRLIWMALLLGLVMAACGDDAGSPFTTRTTSTPTTAETGTTGAGEEYPPEVIDGYIEGCSEDGDEAFCRCTIEEFQRRLPLSDFIALAQSDIESDPIARDVIEICLRETGGTTTTTPGTTAATVTTSAFEPITDIETIISLTIQDLEVFWSEVMPDVWGVDYAPVSMVGRYLVSEGDVPECGGPLSEEVYIANAFYCSLDDSVQWDEENLMAPLFGEFGDFTVALVLAHEWGHAVQERFGFDDLANPTIISELQADCFAGAWTAYIDAEQSDLLRLEPGDLEEGMAGFLLIGDQLGVSPEAQNAHGGSFDRLTAFFDGFNLGAAECTSYEDPETPPDIVFIPLQAGEDPVEGGDLDLAEAAPLLIDSLEVFWDIVYPDLFGEPWVPVSRTIPYSPSTGDFPACDGQAFDRSFYEGNAFYCAADDYVGWDDESFFPDLHREVGDFAVGLVLANEWGRAVQVRAGLPTESVGAQLQVDCLSGVFTAALTFTDNPTPLILSAGDLEEGIAGFLQLSASPGTEGAATAFDRFEAFKDGFLDGAAACNL